MNIIFHSVTGGRVAGTESAADAMSCIRTKNDKNAINANLQYLQNTSDSVPGRGLRINGVRDALAGLLAFVGPSTPSRMPKTWIANVGASNFSVALSDIAGATDARLSAMIGFPGAESVVLPQEPDLHSLWDVAKRIHEAISEANLLGTVKAIADTDSIRHGRRAVIEGRLEELGLKWQRLPYVSERKGPTGESMKGINIEADAGPIRGYPFVLIGAHFDRVSQGTGVVDNSAGCAAVLELAQRFRLNPLLDLDVKIAFFDQEEDGIVGSQAYVDACKATKNYPYLYLNLDFFANGTELSVSPTSVAHSISGLFFPEAGEATEKVDSMAETAFLTALNATSSLYVNRTKTAQPGDHLSFQQEEIAASGMSLADPQQGDRLLAFGDAAWSYVADPTDKKKESYEYTAADVLGRAHSEADRIEALNPTDMLLGIEAVEEALRKLTPS